MNRLNYMVLRGSTDWTKMYHILFAVRCPQNVKSSEPGWPHEHSKLFWNGYKGEME